MNKRGSVKRLMFEIAYISFAVLIGLSVLVYVYSLTNDTTLKAKIYAEDIANTINSMNNAKAFKIKVTYELPEVYKFNLDQEYVYVNDKEIKIKYNNKQNSKISFTRNKDSLVIEKNEQESLV